MSKVKLAIVYQVIFHYRAPFYNHVANDGCYDSILFYGKGVPGTKLKNSGKTIIRKKQFITSKIPFKLNGHKSSFSFFPFLFFNLIRYSPDIMLVEGASSLLNFISAFIYAKLFRKKIIMWSLGKVEGKPLSKPRIMMDSLINYLEKRSDAIFAYSSFAKEYFLKRGVKEEKIFVGVNVIDTKQKLKELSKIKNKNVNSEEFRILFVGSIIKVKKLEILIDAFEILLKHRNNVYLDIVGDGSDYYHELKLKVEKKGVKNIIFHGKIIEGLVNYYLRSDVFVLPGLGGLAISEAMICGLPVICTYADGTEIDLVKNGVGVFIDQMSVDNLFQELDYYYKHRDELNSMGKEAKKLIQTKYSFDNYYSSFDNCVKSCISK